jgi:hypothetical protein
VKQELHSGKKRSHKAKGRFKVGGKTRQLEPCNIINEEDEEEEISFNFNKETCLHSKVSVRIPTNKGGEEENKDVMGLEDESCVSNVQGEVILPMTESEPPHKSFQDIVEEAMRQSNISFTDDPDNDKATLMMLDETVTNAENACSSKDKKFETCEESTQRLGVPTVNIKSSWNTVDVHQRSTDRGKTYTARNKSGQESLNKSANNNIALLQPKTCKKSLILPNNVGFSPLIINAGIHQAQALPTVLSSNIQAYRSGSPTTLSSSAASFLLPQCEVDKKSPVSTQLDAKVLNMVGSDRLSIISADSQQGTIMLIADDCNSFTTV